MHFVNAINDKLTDNDIPPTNPSIPSKKTAGSQQSRYQILIAKSVICAIIQTEIADVTCRLPLKHYSLRKIPLTNWSAVFLLFSYYQRTLIGQYQLPLLNGTNSSLMQRIIPG